MSTRITLLTTFGSIHPATMPARKALMSSGVAVYSCQLGFRSFFSLSSLFHSSFSSPFPFHSWVKSIGSPHKVTIFSPFPIPILSLRVTTLHSQPPLPCLSALRTIFGWNKIHVTTLKKTRRAHPFGCLGEYYFLGGIGELTPFPVD